MKGTSGEVGERREGEKASRLRRGRIKGRIKRRQKIGGTDEVTIKKRTKKKKKIKSTRRRDRERKKRERETFISCTTNYRLCLLVEANFLPTYFFLNISFTHFFFHQLNSFSFS